MSSGSLRQRYPGSWSIILDLGYETDPATGKRRRRQKWVTFYPTPGLSLRDQRSQAEAKKHELINAENNGTRLEPSKTTLLDWLREWVKTSAKPSEWRPATIRLYRSIIEQHIAKHQIAFIPLQGLRTSDLERYLADVPGAAGSVAVHHAVLHCALESAVTNKLLIVSPAIKKLKRRRASKDHARAARAHCWSTLEARRFIEAAKTASTQVTAFMLLALDSGARRSELAGLLWTDFDLDASTITIERQLDKAGATVIGDPDLYGPTKTGLPRTFSLGPETIAALRVHKQAQAELKMRNRTSYCDFGLVFAKETEDLQRPTAALGQPLATLGDARFVRLIAKAGIKRIKFHGLRHTSATLDLQSGTEVHVVAARLGHANVSMTLNVYAHALPGQQQAAATRRSALLHG
jgi:integrase